MGWDLGALLVSNWHFAAQGTDYFHASDAVSPLQNFWSLSVEEQFYLVWPGLVLLLVLLVPAAARREAGARVAVAVAAIVLGGASFAWALTQTGAQPIVAYFSTLTRAWELAAGALLAASAPLWARMPRVLGALLSWVGVAGIAWSCAVIEPASPGFPAPWAALPVAATGLALIGGVGGDPRHRHLFPLTNPVSVFIGDMSYSLYLWHFPVIVFAAVVLPPSDYRLWVVLGAIAVASLASYLIVEQPLRYAPILGGRMPGATASNQGPPPGERQPPRTSPPGPPAPGGARGVASTRPAGWTPGTRYYPGSTRSAPPPMVASVAARETPGADPVLTVAAPGVMGNPQIAGAEVSTQAAPPAVPAVSWRERFGGQIFLATAGLVVVALATAMWVHSASGGAPLLRPPAVAGPAQEPAEDPTAHLQNELAAAVAATSWPELHPSLDEVMAQSSGANPAHDCFSPDTQPDLAACTWGNPDAPTRIYLVGDSTAMAYAPAFRALADDSGGQIRATTVGLYGCRFTDVLVHNDGDGVMAACDQRKQAVRQAIAADLPDLVVMSNAFTLGRTAGGDDLSAEELIAAERAEAASYALPGRIVYLAPPPTGANLGACYSPLSSPSACSVAVDDTWQRMWSASVSAAAADGDHTIDALPFSCWDGVCPAFAGTLPIKYDQTHLTVPYAQHIAPYLRWALTSQGLLGGS